ncbi:MAG: hypothetical protein K2Q03_07190 [Sphingobacteriaceae bacterium]|nr:hypothetical protein [Sphingobacteriaceae bacterium]
MKKISLTLLVATFGFSATTFAQYAGDALRFSQTNYGSNARFKAMGNAQVGVGGDMSSMSANPAGLGLMTKSDFSLTPEFNSANAQSTFLGEQSDNSRLKLNFNQIGAAFYLPMFTSSKRKPGSDEIISFVFGLGYNRNNDFNIENYHSGTNYSNSINNYFAELGGSTTPNTLPTDGERRLARPAFDDYNINYDATNAKYTSGINTKEGVLQSRNDRKSGGTSEFNISSALNLGNQLYFGLSLGIVSVRYRSEASYEENGWANRYNDKGVQLADVKYNSFYNQTQETRGSGVNLKLGVMYKPAPFFRVGATLHTPSWIQITDSYTEGLDNTKTQDGSAYSQIYDFEYAITTPLKASLGTSFIIGNSAIISADVDYVDYSMINFSRSAAAEQTLNIDVNTINKNNKEVRDKYTGAMNYRVGGEYKINQFSVRMGYGLNGSPYKNDGSGYFDTQIYSGGLGYRFGDYYLDLTYQQVKNKTNYSTYTLSDNSHPVATFANTFNNTFLTFGVKF